MSAECPDRGFDVDVGHLCNVAWHSSRTSLLIVKSWRAAVTYLLSLEPDIKKREYEHCATPPRKTLSRKPEQISAFDERSKAIPDPHSMA
jgi:hypothetical protein